MEHPCSFLLLFLLFWWRSWWTYFHSCVGLVWHVKRVYISTANVAIPNHWNITVFLCIPLTFVFGLIACQVMGSSASKVGLALCSVLLVAGGNIGSCIRSLVPCIIVTLPCQATTWILGEGVGEGLPGGTGSIHQPVLQICCSPQARRNWSNSFCLLPTKNIEWLLSHVKSHSFCLSSTKNIECLLSHVKLISNNGWIVASSIWLMILLISRILPAAEKRDNEEGLSCLKRNGPFLWWARELWG